VHEIYNKSTANINFFLPIGPIADLPLKKYREKSEENRGDTGKSEKKPKIESGDKKDRNSEQYDPIPGHSVFTKESHLGSAIGFGRQNADDQYGTVVSPWLISRCTCVPRTCVDFREFLDSEARQVRQNAGVILYK
jgi:hypothetical protein